MLETSDLLVEIGTEELPPKALKRLSEVFSSALCAELKQQQLKYTIATPFATPRRLAVIIKGVAVKQADREVEKRGPAVQAAFDKTTGEATKAAMGFARSCQVAVDDLERLTTEKGEWLLYRSSQVGKMTVDLLPSMIKNALAILPIPKRMRWSNLPYEFVRPVHWVVILLGNEVVKANLFGIASDRKTYGHRFHHPQALVINNVHDYTKFLEQQAYVIPSFTKRREKIHLLIKEKQEEIGGEAVIDSDLLDEVTGLVEYPVAIAGHFDEKFLELPPEVLIASMKGHQKYFHLVNEYGNLLPYFITISNIQSKQPQLIQAGNERVLRPRLSDADFFWKQDCNQSLESHLDQLKTVIFQKKLGSLYDKSKRMARVTGIIAKQLGAEELQGIRVALLSKCDLMTNMVGEFPELQGIMGEYYAKHDKETKAVAIALREQYMPRFWGDKLPKTVLGQAISITDKLDTLVGIFGIGQAPTGDKDPYGLRRAALSILRIAIECQLSLNLQQLLQETQATYTDNIKAGTNERVFEFILERLKSYYQEQGINLDSIEAILACKPVSPLDITQRLQAIEQFRQLPEAASLASANKRIHNILKKAKLSFPDEPDQIHFTHQAERRLYDELETISEKINPLIQAKSYQAALQHLASLRESVDYFFDNVMVMDKNETIRINRLAFLQKIRLLFLQIADISKLGSPK